MSISWQFFGNPDNSLHDINLEGLAKSALDAFDIIEQWQSKQHFEHHLIKEMVNKIVQQGAPYYSAIQKSASSAAKGMFFAKDAVDFCERLIRAQDSLENLKSALEDIKQVAKAAHDDAKEMSKQFKNIRVELFRIFKDVPSHIAKVMEEQERNSRSDLPTPHLVVFPKQDDHASDHNRQILEPILSEFKRATDDLNTLIRHVSSFVLWWGDMNTSLAHLEVILPQIKIAGGNPFRSETAKERWMDVYNKYVWYQRQISNVEDFYKNLSGDASPVRNADGMKGVGDEQWPVERRSLALESSRRENDANHRGLYNRRQAEESRKAQTEAQRFNDKAREAEERQRAAYTAGAILDAKRPAEEEKSITEGAMRLAEQKAEDKRVTEKKGITAISTKRREEEAKEKRLAEDRRKADIRTVKPGEEAIEKKRAEDGAKHKAIHEEINKIEGVEMRVLDTRQAEMKRMPGIEANRLAPDEHEKDLSERQQAARRRKQEVDSTEQRAAEDQRAAVDTDIWEAAEVENKAPEKSRAEKRRRAEIDTSRRDNEVEQRTLNGKLRLERTIEERRNADEEGRKEERRAQQRQRDAEARTRTVERERLAKQSRLTDDMAMRMAAELETKRLPLADERHVENERLRTATLPHISQASTNPPPPPSPPPTPKSKCCIIT